MSGRLGDLSPEQKNALVEFKDKCRDILTKPEHDDAMCLRFLRARNFNVDASTAMFKNTLEFRRMHRIDQITTEWFPNPALYASFPGGIHPIGIDKDGGVVVVYPMRNMLPKYYFMFARPMEIIKVVHLRMENALKLLRQQSKKLGRNVEHVTVITDLDGFDVMAQLRSTAGLNVFRGMSGTYDFLYPETMSRCVFINAPPLFSLMFNLLKSLFNKVTVDKMRFFGKEPEKWKPYLLSIIDADQLPKNFGGTKVGKNGEEDCSDEIVHIREMNDKVARELLELIPEVERVRTVTIARRSNHEESFGILEKGGGFRVEFEAECFDIGFQLLVRTMDGNEREAIVYKKYNCSVGPVMICIRCDYSGEYVLHFDNTFSAMRSKKIYYNVKIIPPEEFSEDMLLVHEP